MSPVGRKRGRFGDGGGRHRGFGGDLTGDARAVEHWFFAPNCDDHSDGAGQPVFNPGALADALGRHRYCHLYGSPATYGERYALRIPFVQSLRHGNRDGDDFTDPV